MTFLQVGQIAQVSIVERWAWYMAALKDPTKIGSAALPIHPGEYQVGYFRTRRKGGAWEPVGIYPDDSGVVHGFRNNMEVSDIPELFTWCCRHPVTHQAYVDALDGKGWPDDDKVVAAQLAAPAPAPADEPTIGDNSGEVDEATTLKDQIEAALAGMKAYEKITDDKTAEKALSLRNRLNELSRDADKIRTREKEPHLEAGKAVDLKWQPLVKRAKAGADQVRDAMSAWETVKLQRRREEERKALEAQRAAEEAARAAEPTSGEPQGETTVLEAPKVDVQPDAAPSTIRGSYGKAASVSAKTVVKEVTDWSALAVYMSSHPEAQALLRQLAQRAIDAGRTVPGITTEEVATVR